jgi:pimeloyl-ACP methyl ester carboxylesterase
MIVYFLSIVALAQPSSQQDFCIRCIGAHRDRLRFAGPAAGSRSAAAHKLYLLEKGSGGPTVLFEAGIAATNLNWFHIQETVARFTHTASYDRGGLGWSSPSRTARTPGNMPSSCTTCWSAPASSRRYILVGHSFGGLVMRRYALSYPEDVAGMVLVDPMRCEEWPPLNPSKQSQLDRGKKLSGFAVPIARFGLGPPGRNFAALPLRPHLRPAGRRRRQRRTPCAGPRHRRSRQDAPRSLAHRSRPLVPPRLLRRHAQPRPPFPTPCARCRTPSPSATSRPAAHARQIHAALRRLSAASATTSSRSLPRKAPTGFTSTSPIWSSIPSARWFWTDYGRQRNCIENDFCSSLWFNIRDVDMLIALITKYAK